MPLSLLIQLYAALGITQALMTLVLGLTMAFFNFYASRNLHKNAVHRVFFAPSSFFDTVPLGRVSLRILPQIFFQVS